MRTALNKGLTKETSTILADLSRQKSNWWTSEDRSETRRKISENHARPGLGKKGPLNSQWKGGRLISKRDGYVMLKKENHPNCNSKGYILEHRLVMESKIGRYLLPDEDVNHINGIKDDNRPENLMLVRHNAHFSMQECPNCGFEWGVR